MPLRKKGLIWFLTILLCLLLIYYLYDQRSLATRILQCTPVSLFTLTVMWIFLSIPRGYTQKLMAKHLGVDLAFIDWYGLSMVTNLLNTVLPARSEMLFGAMYLRQKYGLRLAHSASMAYGSTLLFAITLSIEGCLALLYVGTIHNYWNLTMWGIMLGTGISSFIFSQLPIRTFDLDHSFFQKLKDMLQGWHLLKSNTRLLYQLSFMSVTSSIAFTGWMYFSYVALGFHVDFIAALLAGIVTQLSFYISITPGNLGVRETMVGFISQLTGMGFAEGVTVTLLQRGLSTIIFTILGSFFGFFIIKNFHKES